MSDSDISTLLPYHNMDTTHTHRAGQKVTTASVALLTHLALHNISSLLVIAVTRRVHDDVVLECAAVASNPLVCHEPDPGREHEFSVFTSKAHRSHLVPFCTSVMVMLMRYQEPESPRPLLSFHTRM